MKKNLNIFDVTLSGKHLIEASAGTGKTSTIIFLYLRLLLGIKCRLLKKSKIKIRNILIVTFTNNAKKELKNRIQKIVYELKKAFETKYTTHPVFISFMKRIKNFNKAIKTLENILSNLDKIAIYTIHSYYKNILDVYKFSFGIIFKNKFLTDVYDIRLNATILFWQRYCYKLPKNISKIIFTYWKEPELLLSYINPFLNSNFGKIVKLSKSYKTSLIEQHETLINYIVFFKKYWIKESKKVFKIYKNTSLANKNYKIKNLFKLFNIITEWSNSDTKNYFIPKELFNLKSKKTLLVLEKKNNLVNEFFVMIEKLLKTKFSLKELFLFYAIRKIKIFVKKIKKNNFQLEFNELETIISKKILNNKTVSTVLKKKYPIAFIDEFQDVNYIQYSIFSKIYKKKDSSLILIGDPKQSIYSFQGSNIFSYLKIRSEIRDIHTLNTNWRSSENMIKSINIIFSKNKTPFLFQDISFFKSFSPKETSFNRNSMSFKIHGIVQSALKIFFVSKKLISLKIYKEKSADKCAANINYWIKKGKEKKAELYFHNTYQFFKIEHAVVIVRNKYESDIIKNSLSKLNIKSKYFSEKKTIFNSTEAKNLFYIMRSILDLNNQKYLNQVIMSNVFFKTFFDVYCLKNNKTLFLDFLKKMHLYKKTWEEFGISFFIKNIISKENINFQISHNKDKLSVILNYLQLAEILENKYDYFNSKKLLLSWLKKKIFYKIKEVKKNYIKKQNFKNCIKIISIHQSKGLEFPIVWIPFGIFFSKNNLCIFYNKKTNSFNLDLENKIKNTLLSKKEIISENLRLLYVALTRSILHCSISVAPVFKKKNSSENIYENGITYLLRKKRFENSKNLFQIFKLVNCKNIINVTNYIRCCYTSETKKKKIFSLKTAEFNRKNLQNWNLFSYSTIIKKNMNESMFFSKFFLKKPRKNQINKTNKTLNVHNFPKGKKIGKFLHFLLKNHDFSYLFNEIWIEKQIKKIDLEKKWCPFLTNWMNSIIKTPLLDKKLKLFKLKSIYFKKEFEFHIPMFKKIKKIDLFNILNNETVSSKKISNQFFTKISGFLHGFIDFLFMYKKKFYILEYKSDWLGTKNSCYSKTTLEQTIVKNHYHIQHKLYSLAIHRYLKLRIVNYKYSTHFGGVIYMFLRSIEENTMNKNNGIFCVTPNFSLINELDQLFSGKF